MTAVLERMRMGQDTVLVTIVGQTGSTPRGTGAQMLVDARGRLDGTVGGGAIESRSVAHALMLLQRRESGYLTFSLDGTAGQALNMVCGGGVGLLFSFIGAEDSLWAETAREAKRRLEESLPGFLVLDTRSGSAQVSDGEGLPCDPSAIGFAGGIEGNFFLLPLPVRQRVILCGGGHVAQALVPVLASVDFRVTVFENRQEFARASLFPGAEQVVLGDYENIAASIDLKDDDFFIIMTHGHVHDFTLQAQLLRRKYSYIGVMGSRRKIAAVNARLLEAGIPQAALDTVHTPIGLPIQAVTPEEIAISVAAECIAVRASLRNDLKSACPAGL